MEDFDALIIEARRQAKKAGMKRSDITAAIKKARGKNNTNKWNCFRFINEEFFRWARPHKDLRRGVHGVRRRRKFAENEVHWEKNYLCSKTIGDKRLWKIRVYKGIQVLRPRKFVDDYLK